MKQEPDQNKVCQLQQRKANRRFAALLAVGDLKAYFGDFFGQLDKEPVMDVTRMEKTEPREAHEDKVSETKPEVPMKEKLEIKNENSVFIKR